MPATDKQGETLKYKPRGFAALPPDQHRAVASKGGKAVHANGNAHRFTPAEARQAGRKGAAVRLSRPFEEDEKVAPYVVLGPSRGVNKGLSLLHQLEVERYTEKRRRFMSAIRQGDSNV